MIRVGSESSEIAEPLAPVVPAGSESASMADLPDQKASALLASYFARMADAVGLPRSVALIYHTLFLAAAPLSFAEIVEISGLSKASASTGLKLLERVRGLEIVTVITDRRTFYKAELSIRRLVSGFIQHTLEPGLDAGDRLLGKPDSGHDWEASLSPLFAERLASVRQWHQLTRDILPLLTLIDPRDSEMLR